MVIFHSYVNVYQRVGRFYGFLAPRNGIFENQRHGFGAMGMRIPPQMGRIGEVRSY